MKRIFLFVPIFIAVFGVSNAARVNAIPIKREQLWSVSELLDLSEEINNERTEICKNNFDCIKTLHDEQLKTNKIYSLIDKIEKWQFIITKIDLNTGVITVVYQDESRTKRWSNPDKISDLQELFLVWIKKTKINTINYKEYGLEDTAYKITIYNKSESDDFGRLFPANVEVTLNMGNNINYEDITQWALGYNADAGINNATYGMYSLDSCINSDDYDDNSECKLMINEDGGSYEFRPAQRNKISTDDNSVSHEEDKIEANEKELTNEVDIIVEEENTNSEHTNTENLDNNNNDGIEVINDGPKRDDIDDQDIENIFFKTPDTGLLTLDVNGRQVDLPWWIITIILFSNIVLVRFFGPKRNK